MISFVKNKFSPIESFKGYFSFSLSHFYVRLHILILKALEVSKILVDLLLFKCV